MDVVGALGFVPPRSFGFVGRALREDDVIVFDGLFDEALRIGNGFLIAGDRFWSWERCDYVGVTTLQIPEVVKIAVREDYETAILRARIFAGLFFADEGIFILGFRLEDD